MGENNDDRVESDLHPEEKRVGDVLRSDEPELVDPELVASLRSWFDGPALGMDALLGQQGETPDATDVPDLDVHALLGLDPDAGPQLEVVQRRKITMDEMDPELFGRLSSQGERANQLLIWRSIEPPTLRVEQELHRLEVPDEADLEIREAEMPFYMDQLLSECTPQSLLRDLARYVMEPGMITPDIHPLPTHGMGNFREDQKETMTASYKQIAEPLVLGGELLDESILELREALAAPWEESLKAKRREISYAEYMEIEAKLMRGEL